MKSGDSGVTGEAEDVTDMAEISVGADDDQWLGLAATQDVGAVGGAVGNNEALIAAGSADDVCPGPAPTRSLV